MERQSAWPLSGLPRTKFGVSPFHGASACADVCVNAHSPILCVAIVHEPLVRELCATVGSYIQCNDSIFYPNRERSTVFAACRVLALYGCYVPAVHGPLGSGQRAAPARFASRIYMPLRCQLSSGSRSRYCSYSKIDALFIKWQVIPGSAKHLLCRTGISKRLRGLLHPSMYQCLAPRPRRVAPFGSRFQLRPHQQLTDGDCW